MIPAVGPYSDVWIFTEQGTQTDLLRSFVESLSHPIEYVFEEENEFDVYVRDFEQFEHNRDRKNIVLYARVDRQGGMLSRVQRLLGKDILARVRREGQLVLYREDLFARDQDVYFLLADGAAGEEQLFTRMAPTLRDRMRDSTRERLRDYLLNGRENKGGGKYLLRRYAFTLRYPAEYRLLQERPDLGAIELHREDPSRVMGVFWQDWDGPAPTVADSTRLLAFRESVVDTLYHGDYLLPEANQFTAVEEAGRSALRLRGIWQNERDMTGGPFVTYFFLDEHRHRLLALDLLLYAPGMAKHPFMRELEALATTFRY
ncbi:DUF4837 family protein [bacterium]|nr:DUF4837 family protein [bacterium]